MIVMCEKCIYLETGGADYYNYCHRNAPRPGKKNDTNWYWPIVGIKDFCGEGKERVKKGDGVDERK